MTESLGNDRNGKHLPRHLTASEIGENHLLSSTETVCPCTLNRRTFLKSAAGLVLLPGMRLRPESGDLRGVSYAIDPGPSDDSATLASLKSSDEQSQDLQQVLVPTENSVSPESTPRSTPASPSAATPEANPVLEPEPDPVSESNAPGRYLPLAIKPLRVAPGLEGFGTDSTGGRGGQILVVTNLNATGAGSFYEATQTQGDRIILFDVSGDIAMGPFSDMAPGKVSIYGQSAPGDGISINCRQDHVGTPLSVTTDDVFIQHCRFRPGAATAMNSDRRALNIGSSSRTVKNVVIDHCSLSWSTDGQLDIWYGAHDITINRCLIYECLFNSTSGPGKQSYGIVMGGGANRISIVNCVMANGDYRFPGIFAVTDLDLFNNLIYGYTFVGTIAQCQYSEENVTGNIEQNLYIDAAQTAYADIDALVNVESSANIRLNVKDNGLILGPDSTKIGSIRVYRLGPIADPTTHPDWSAAPVAAPRPPLIPLDQLEGNLLADVGAMAPVRDDADARIISQIRSRYVQLVDLVDGDIVTADNAASVGTNRDVPRPVLAGGPSRLGSAPDYVPKAWKIANGLATSVNALTTDSNGDGYPDIEDWLASLA